MAVATFLSYLILGIMSLQGLDSELLLGKWQTVRVEYLDRDAPWGKEGEKLVLEFKNDGTCINHEFGSATNYSMSGRIVDMGGYKIIIEKLTDKKMVFREKKDFFIRRFFCERIIPEQDDQVVNQ
jgi:hypothetical protein